MEKKILELFGLSEMPNSENDKKRKANTSSHPVEDDKFLNVLNSDRENDSDFLISLGPDLLGNEEDRKRVKLLPKKKRVILLEQRKTRKKLYMEKRELRKDLEERIKSGNLVIEENLRRKKKRTKESLGEDEGSPKKKTLKKGNTTKIRETKCKNYEEEDANTIKYESKLGDNRGFGQCMKGTLLKHQTPKRREKLDIDNKSSSESRNVLIDEPLISLSDLNTIWLSQDLVDKWIYTPMFSKAVTGAYVKVQANKDGKGPYTVAQVTGVLEDSTPYFLKRHYVDVRLRVCVGDNRIDVEVGALSNTPITTAEYQQLEALRQKDPDSLMEYPVQKIFEKKKQDISEKNEYIITSKDIDHRVNMFKKAGAGADSEIQKRAELSRQYQIARQNEDHEKMEQIRREMNDLPSSRLSNKSQSSFAYNSRVSKIGVSRPQSFLNSKPAVKLGASLPSARNSANNSAVNLQSQKFRQPTNAPTQNIVQNQPSQSTDNQYLAHLPYADTDVPADTDNELGPTPGTSGSHNLIFKSNNPKNPKLELPLPTRKNKNYAKIMACASFDLSFVK
ncbi:hypothetical protein BB560_003220 [Smittium megazygosporum]|uniref:Plus3 domain-containing protein n=1 Tax=Smittium megazygosporum TaxID=133381 RepID=A0A2T9ZCQ5_9FUNG|nr:hypothetical protein BB560_003220 [Smittium megazygosporum]